MDYGQRGGTLTGTPTPVNPWNDPYPGPGSSRPPRAACCAHSTCAPRAIRGPTDRHHPDRSGQRQRPVATTPSRTRRRRQQHEADDRDRAPQPLPDHRPPATGRCTSRDVGNGTWEEVDRVTLQGPATPTTLSDFGWPCYEGAAQQPPFASLNTTMCNNLYAQQASQPGTVTPPLYQYTHSGSLTPKGPCFPGSADRRRPSPASRSTRARRAAPSTTRPSTTAHCSSSTTAATASGRSCPRPTASPTPPRWSRSPAASPTRSTSRPERAATCTR